MSSFVLPTGAFAACYAGDTGVSTVLSKINNLRTDGAVIKDELPTVYLPVLNTSIQNGLHRVSVSITFYNPDDTLVKLSRGIALTGLADDPIDQKKYVLLLLHRDPNIKQSYLFPDIRTEKIMEIPYLKTAGSAIKIDFIAEHRDVTVDLIYKDTHAVLKSILGSRSPI